MPRVINMNKPFRVCLLPVLLASGICDDPGDKYEQAIQGLLTAGTSGFSVLQLR